MEQLQGLSPTVRSEAQRTISHQPDEDKGKGPSKTPKQEIFQSKRIKHKSDLLDHSKLAGNKTIFNARHNINHHIKSLQRKNNFSRKVQSTEQGIHLRPQRY